MQTVYSSSSSQSVLGRPVLFQLVLVQSIYDRGESLDGVAQVVNSHPLLAPLDSPITDEDAKELYEAMLDHYNARAEGPGKKKGLSKQIELLAHSVFNTYIQELLSLIQEDKDEFQRVYKEAQELMNFDQS